MALRTDARYEFGLNFLRFLPHNDDHTVATKANVYSSVGPWDFSGVDDTSSIPLYTQVDDGELITRSVDLGGVVDITAVTPAELVEAIEAATSTGYDSYDIRVTDGGDTRVTTSGDVRILHDPYDAFAVDDDRIVVTAATATYWVQVFGELAETAGFGQGFGLRWISCDTMQNVGEQKRDVGSSIHTTRDGSGEATEVREQPRLGGRDLSIVDTATDYSLKTMIDGQGRSFYIEMYTPVYRSGHNAEDHPLAYVQEKIYNCVGRSLGKTRERGWSVQPYSVQATKGAGYNVDYDAETITPSEYNALGLRGY